MINQRLLYFPYSSFMQIDISHFCIILWEDYAKAIESKLRISHK